MNEVPFEKPAEKRVWGFWETTGFGGVIGIAFVFTQLIVGMVFGFIIALTQAQGIGSFSAETLLSYVKDMEGFILSIITIATTVVGVGLIILFILLRRGAGIKEYLGLKKVSVKTSLVTLAIMIGFIALSDVTTTVTGRPVVNDFMINIYRTSLWLPLLWFVLIIAGPLFEETFFRGFLFKGWSQSKLGIAGTILLTSIIWTAMHTQYELQELAHIFVMGVMFGAVRYKTGSLSYPLIMHAFANLVAMVETMLFLNGIL